MRTRGGRPSTDRPGPHPQCPHASDHRSLPTEAAGTPDDVFAELRHGMGGMHMGNDSSSPSSSSGHDMGGMGMRGGMDGMSSSPSASSSSGGTGGSSC